MKPFSCALLALLLAAPSWAADTKVEDDTNLATLETGDEFYCVDDPGGTPLSRACTIDVIQTFVLQGEAATCTALASNPTDCSANQFANAIAASGNLTCAAIADADVPDTITIDLAATATALAANGANCSAGSYPLGVDASGAVESCTDATTEIDSAISTHAGDAGAHHTKTTSAAELSSGTIPAARVGAAHIDTITEIAAGLKSGADGTLITGTAGSANQAAVFNGDGDVVGAATTMTVGSPSDPADSGNIRFDNAATICWEASPAGTDVCVDVDSSEEFGISDGTWDLANAKANSLPSSAIDTIVMSVPIQIGGATADGTQCADAAKATVNSVPMHTIICADNDASSIYFDFPLPDSYDGGTFVVKQHYIQTAADTSALNGDIAAFCRDAAESGNTYGTEVALDDAAVTGSNGEDELVSAAVTGNGCSAGEARAYFRYQLDATGTTTAVATLHFTSFLVEYTSTVGD